MSASVARWTLLAALALAIGCSSPPTPDEDDAADAVRQLFDALVRGDCREIRSVVPGIADDAACQDYLEEWREHGTTLLAVRSVDRDARDPRAFLVHTRLRAGAHERDGVSRAVPGEDGHGWTIDP